MKKINVLVFSHFVEWLQCQIQASRKNIIDCDIFPLPEKVLSIVATHSRADVADRIPVWLARIPGTYYYESIVFETICIIFFLFILRKKKRFSKIYSCTPFILYAARNIWQQPIPLTRHEHQQHVVWHRAEKAVRPIQAQGHTGSTYYYHNRFERIWY